MSGVPTATCVRLCLQGLIGAKGDRGPIGSPGPKVSIQTPPKHKNEADPKFPLVKTFKKSFQGQPGPSGEPGPPVSINRFASSAFCQFEV